MRRLAAAVPLVLAVLLGVAPAPDRPAKKGAAATPTPAAEEPDDATPTPTPEPPRFLAALESTQGDGGERVAVFADGTVSRSVRWKTRTVLSRLLLSREELDVIRRVVAEALAATNEETPRGDVLATASERRMRLEIATPDGDSRSFVFDDASSLPLAAGRARGALEDLRSRFEKLTPAGDPDWDPGDVAPGDRLRRKIDGAWFVVARDDSFERNLELRAVDGDLVMWVARDQLPKHFYDPALPSPEPAPREAPQ